LNLHHRLWGTQSSFFLDDLNSTCLFLRTWWNCNKRRSGIISGVCFFYWSNLGCVFNVIFGRIIVSFSTTSDASLAADGSVWVTRSRRGYFTSNIELLVEKITKFCCFFCKLRETLKKSLSLKLEFNFSRGGFMAGWCSTTHLLLLWFWFCFMEGIVFSGDGIFCFYLN